MIPTREEIIAKREKDGLKDGKALLSALRAWGRGDMSKSQQMMVLQFVTIDLGGMYTGADPKWSEREAGMADGRAEIAKTLMLHCGLQITSPDANQAHATPSSEDE